jgi:hypothetical protein
MTLELVQELGVGLQPANFISSSVTLLQAGHRIAHLRRQILPCLKYKLFDFGSTNI